MTSGVPGPGGGAERPATASGKRDGLAAPVTGVRLPVGPGRLPER